MDKDIFYCKRDVWQNIEYDDDKRIQLKSSLDSISQELSFVKEHDKSRLVFKKGGKYKKTQEVSDGVLMYSVLISDHFLFKYNLYKNYMYFHSGFLPIKLERKIKIKKMLRENK